MSYLVLARKYRPQTFQDVAAQDHITRTLQNSLRNNRVGSGYLFCGPRGTGKTTTARILAKALNCVNGPTPDPCGECSACTEIAAGSSLDVLEIDAASNTGVDDIRTLRENVRYMPTGGHKRIYIIDEVHRLSAAAFDALLKTLEEPPEHVLFIFATTEPTKVPETILSRTQRYDFKRVSAIDLIGNMKRICESEGFEISEAALTILARKADGSVRDSLSLLDQISAFAGDKISETDVIDGLGLVDKQLLFDLTTAIASGNNAEVLKVVKQVIDSGADSSDFAAELMEHFRVLLVLASVKDSTDLLDLTEDEMKDYRAQADYFSVGDVIRLMKMASEMNGMLRSGLNERLVLEMTTIKMAEMESTVLLQDVIDKLGETHTSVKPAETDLFGSTEKKKSRDISESPKQIGHERMTLVRPVGEGVSGASPPLARGVNIPQLKQGWKQYLGILRQKSPMLASQLGMAAIVDIEENRIVLSFAASEEASKQLVEKPENLRMITELLRNHYRANLSVVFKIDPNREGIVTQHEDRKKSVDVKQLVENSPRLKGLIEKIDGEIIGVRDSTKN